MGFIYMMSDLVSSIYKHGDRLPLKTRKFDYHFITYCPMGAYS